METKFYTFFIEQVFTNNALSEYASVSPYATHQQAQVAYFDKLKNVSNAMGNTHRYCRAEIRDSFGNVFENNVLGKRENASDEQLANE